MIELGGGLTWARMNIAIPQKLWHQLALIVS